jgi:thioredoxin-related protein
MKFKLVFLILFMGSLTLSAQEWLSDFESAKEIALEKNQRIVLVFQGSDWCAPCIKLEKEIWDSMEFNTYAKNNFVLLKADFPRKKKNQLSEIQQEKNNKLAEKYNPNGFFPRVVVLNKNAEIIGSTGYKKISPADYIKLLNSFN